MLETQFRLSDEKPSLNCRPAVCAPDLGRTVYSHFLPSVAQQNLMWLKLVVMQKNLIKYIRGYKIRNNTVAKQKVDRKKCISLDNAKRFSSRCCGGLSVQGQRREVMGSDIHTVETIAPILCPQRCLPPCSWDTSTKDIFPRGAGSLLL